MIDIFVWAVLAAMALIAAVIAVRKHRASAVGEAELDRLLADLDRAEAPDPADAHAAQERFLARVLAEHPAPGTDSPSVAPTGACPGPTSRPNRRARRSGTEEVVVNVLGVAVVGAGCAALVCILAFGSIMTGGVTALVLLNLARLVPLPRCWQSVLRRRGGTWLKWAERSASRDRQQR